MSDTIRFKVGDDGFWWPDEPNKALLWQQGVFVTHITDTDVGLGSCREPLGSQSRDEIVDKWLDERVEWVTSP